MSLKFLFIERPYLNYEFVSDGKHWHDRYNFPELDTPETETECFLKKFKPQNCAEGGYVHMFPAFYKHCVIYDMKLYEKQPIE